MAEEELAQNEGEEVIHDDPPSEESNAGEEDRGLDASDEISPESLASELGWCPKEDWRGDPEEWKPAKDFLRSTVDINKSLRKDLRATREASERAARAAAAITERAVEQERQKLLAARREAIETYADPQAVEHIDQQIQQLPQPQRPDMPINSPESQDFIRRNATWFNIDPLATQIAANVCEMQARQGVSDFGAQLAEAEKVVRKRFPEYFEAERPKGKAPASVETAGSRAAAQPRKGPKGFNDLPPEAKAAALDFEKRGRATKDEYAQLYWQENA